MNKSEQTNPCEALVEIANRRGLHARASAKFVKIAEGFNADVCVTKDGVDVPGTSIMGLMLLAAAPGDKISIRTKGPDAKSALEALVQLVEQKFHED